MSKPDRKEELEYMKRTKMCGPVAIQGHAGSFSEAAARAYFFPETQLVSQPDFKALFASVEDGSCACGVVPIENSLMGSIHENYDLLLQSDVHIVGEIKLRIVHNLIVNRGVQLADIRYIASQPPALAQCTRFIHSLAGAQTIATDDTAGAVKELAASGARDRGAIAGARAAAVYGLEILVPGIEDAAHNFTRFLVVNRCATSAPAEPAKTTLVFATKAPTGRVVSEASRLLPSAASTCSKSSRGPCPSGLGNTSSISIWRATWDRRLAPKPWSNFGKPPNSSASWARTSRAIRSRTYSKREWRPPSKKKPSENPLSLVLKAY